MARRSKLWRQFPWIGGINTTSAPSLVPDNQLVDAQNLFLKISKGKESKAKREGIDKNWDDATSGSNSIRAMLDFWYLSGGSKLHVKASLDENGAFLEYDPDDGSTTALTDDGLTMSTVSDASSITFDNKAIFASTGTSNRIKKWAGTGNNVEDLLNNFDHTTLSRSASGTTRNIVLGETFKGSVGDYAVISGMSESSYNGTYAITGLSTTTLTDDTITYTVAGSLTEGSTGDTGGEVDGLAPNGSILGTHQGRLLTNDKTRPYRVHYSPPFDGETWGGYKDSGVIDLDPNDGDPVGVTAIFPTFKGTLFIAKSRKLYRVSGLIPFHTIELVTPDLGCVGQGAVAAIDNQDVVFTSHKGIHSLAVTDQYGDFEDKYISSDIQKSFNEDWEQSRKDKIKLTYLTDENTIFVAVTESLVSTTENNAIWLYNVNFRQWVSRWPNLSCESLMIATDTDRSRLYLGSSTGRVYQAFTGDKADTTEAGASQAITWMIKTGTIYVENNPYVLTGFKRLILYYQPKSNQTITATVRIDQLPSDAVTYDEGGGGTPLGTGFTLGVTALGSAGLFAPYTQTIDGWGRGIQIALTEAAVAGEFSIEGIGLEYVTDGVEPDINKGTIGD